MSIVGKFIGQGIFVEELNETYSFEEIDTGDIDFFKQFVGFLNKNELIQLLHYYDKNENLVRSSYINNILSKIK